MFDSAAAIASLPHLPGVYRMVSGAGEVLYVGKARAEGMVKLREDGRYERALHAIAGIGSRDGELPLGS